MELNGRPTGIATLENARKIEKTTPCDRVAALGGNPNVGKSTVFNALTGLNQHTGNWPGKTVANARGVYTYKDSNFILVDIPGTYSLMANSAEEEVARDFICFGNPDATVIVVDATCLERNLNLVLQTLEITSKAVVCVNLMDEANRKGIRIDMEALSEALGIPVVGTCAAAKKGLDELMESVHKVSAGQIQTKPAQVKYSAAIEQSISALKVTLAPLLKDKLSARWIAIKLIEYDRSLLHSISMHLGFDLLQDKKLAETLADEKKKLAAQGISCDAFRDIIVSRIVKTAEEICRSTVTVQDRDYNKTDRKIDKYLTSKKFGIPMMILLLLGVFWLTITGANYPSDLLANGLFWIQERLTEFLLQTGAAPWINEAFVLGIYKTVAWVVSVMLPPMAIFFPLFTLLEDLGYLPRIAFNLDRFFKKACACGKQALCMCMGFGCNAAGVIGCRIIDSPRERLIAVITNSFVPCNGRFPMLIAIIGMFFAGMAVSPFDSVISAMVLTGVIVLGVVMTLQISRLLSKTILKGIPSGFTLELPPYRKPQVGKIIVRSMLDRTLFVLRRAVVVAAPAGLLIWAMANIYIGDATLLRHCADFLQPFAGAIGMDGFILMAFILGFPANEIVIPIIVMSYLATGSIQNIDSTEQLRSLLVSNGWTWLTAVNVMLFSLMHWPCATTCMTIRKETQSLKWTTVSIAVPTAAGFAVCFIVTWAARLFGLA